jgi:Protein of unknown function (DUF732)
MKRVLALGLISLAACGGTETVYVDRTDAPDTTVKVVRTTDAPIATPAPPAWSEEDEFLWDIQNEFGYTGVNDSDLIETGYLVCDSLRAGAQAWDVATALEQSASDYRTRDMLIAVTASAVLNFCPDQYYKFE